MGKAALTIANEPVANIVNKGVFTCSGAPCWIAVCRPESAEVPVLLWILLLHRHGRQAAKEQQIWQVQRYHSHCTVRDPFCLKVSQAPPSRADVTWHHYDPISRFLLVSRTEQPRVRCRGPEEHLRAGSRRRSQPERTLRKLARSWPSTHLANTYSEAAQ